MPLNNLKDFNFKISYDPSYDGIDVLQDFYIPCLSVSKRYDRCSAYFSSATLKSFGHGLQKFCSNDGHIRFIFSCEIDENELSIIEKAYEEKMNNLEGNIDKTADYDYEIANLSYLIAKGIAEVKIAFMLKNKSSLMHIKSGLFEDFDGNKVYFDGSGNETNAGILLNAEVFNVFNNFNGANEYVNNGENRFNKIWDNTYSPNSIITLYPCGKLFEKLKSYSRNRTFDSQEELFEYEDCVYADIDRKNKSIILKDYTSNYLLSIPMVLKTKFLNKRENNGKNTYIVSELSLNSLKTIKKTIEMFGGKCILSLNADLYIEEVDLELDKRNKLGVSIKNKENIELWNTEYLKFKNVVNYETETHLKEKQLENAFYHYCMKSSANFSVPGTGKTFISYGLFAYLSSKFRTNNEVNSLVVFGPLNCFKAWTEEGTKIFGQKRNLNIFNIANHHNDFISCIKTKRYDVYLINYEYLIDKRIDLIANEILTNRTMVVFDEIHKLKSISGVRANNFIKLFSIANSKPIYKLALTGTPIPNSFEDIFNYLKILYPEDMHGIYSQISPSRLREANENPYVEEYIQKLLYPIFVRTTKKDLFVPKPEPDDLNSLGVIPSETERKLYQTIWMNYKDPLARFIRLIQASSNPKLLSIAIDSSEINSIVSEDYDENFSSYSFENVFNDDIKNLVNEIGYSSKMKKTLSFVRELVQKGEKVIIWCLFINTIDLINVQLKECKINSITICGRDSFEARNKKIDDFKYGNAQVLITNPNTLAESVSLHLSCHNAIYFEYGFNLTYLLQSKDRIHRVGLEANQKTNYYFAVSKSRDYEKLPIDELIYDRLQIKAQRMLNAIETDKLVITDVASDLEDIKDILNELL